MDRAGGPSPGAPGNLGGTRTVSVVSGEDATMQRWATTGWRRAAAGLAVALAAATAATAPPPGGAPAGASAPTTPRVVAAAPRGWLPVAYGDAQISVPSSWSLVTAGAAGCGPATGVVLLGGGSWCPASMHAPASPGTSVVTLRTTTSSATGGGPPVMVVHGLAVYAPGVAAVYVVPALHTELTVSGPPQPRVLRTLTYSPRAVVLAGRASPPPPRWRRVTFGGVALRVPSAWPVRRPGYAPPCATDLVLAEPGVTLARAAPLPVLCPLSEALVRPVPQVAGVEVDAYPRAWTPGRCTGAARIGGMRVCIAASPASGVLKVRVQPPHGTAVTVRLGLFGRGLVDATVLSSLRPA